MGDLIIGQKTRLSMKNNYLTCFFIINYNYLIYIFISLINYLSRIHNIYTIFNHICQLSLSSKYHIRAPLLY